MIIRSKPDFLAPAVEVFGPDLTGNFTRRTGTMCGTQACYGRGSGTVVRMGSRAWEFQ